MSEPLLLVDSNHLCYYHSFRNMHFSYGEKPVGVIFGFLTSVLSLAKMFDTNRFAFAWDSRQSLRKVFYPEYKEHRREKTVVELKTMFPQFVELRRKVLPKFGFKNIFHQVGYEADDIIGSICKRNRNEEIVIISSDNDLYQLLDKDHSMYSIQSKKKYSSSDFIKEWGFEPSRWAGVKTVAGCSSDNVKGVEGVGNKKAVQYLLGKMSDKSQVKAKIEKEGREGLFVKNDRLVRLPFEGTQECVLQEDEFFLSDFFDLCDKYGFNSFLAQELVWRECFDMKEERRE